MPDRLLEFFSHHFFYLSKKEILSQKIQNNFLIQKKEKKSKNIKILITPSHCRMRRQSLCLVMAVNQNSGIDVFFGAEFNFRVQIPDFQRAHHYKVSKNHFSGCQHQKGLFTRAGLKLLRVSVKWTILPLFTCPTQLLEACRQISDARPTQLLEACQRISDARA